MVQTEIRTGMFCWLDLSTPDTAASKQFYTDIFGWHYQDIPAGPDSIYTMALKSGDRVAALYFDNHEGIPAHWMPYVSVSDVEEVVKRSLELGASIVHPTMDVMGAGRMASIMDPGHAIFKLWQPLSHAGFGITEEIGALTWMELNTNDPVTQFDFYHKLFGWTSQEGEDGTGQYTHFICGGQKQAGMMKIQPEWGEVPPHWLPYFQVADINETMTAVKDKGGQVYMGPIHVKGTGDCAVMADPQGAVFAGISMAV